MAWYDSLAGAPARTEQLQRFNPQQQNALSQLLSQGLQGIQPQNSGAGFEPIAKQARTQFQEQTVPGLAERFTSMGNGALSSPAFASQLGQAGAGLEQGLAAQQAQYGLQQQGLSQNLLGLGLTPQFENIYQQRQPGFLESAGGSALQALLMYLSGGLGGGGQSGILGALGGLLGQSNPQQNQFQGSYNAPGLSGNQALQNLLRGY